MREIQPGVVLYDIKGRRREVSFCKSNPTRTVERLHEKELDESAKDAKISNVESAKKKLLANSQSRKRVIDIVIKRGTGKLQKENVRYVVI